MEKNQVFSGLCPFGRCLSGPCPFEQLSDTRLTIGLTQAYPGIPGLT